MYKKDTPHSRKFRNMREAKRRKRENELAPEYPLELPNLRRRITVIDYDSGRPIRYCIDLYKTDRIDCYRAIANGRAWKDRIGWSKAIEALRKSFVRVRAVIY